MEPPTTPPDDHPAATDDTEVTGPVSVQSEPVMPSIDVATATVDELVDAARQDHHGAFEELVRRTHGDTYALALRLVSNEDDARDVVQDTYLRAFRSIHKFRGDSQFTTWLYRITANCASTYMGRRRRHRHEAFDDDLNVVDIRAEHDPVAVADGAMLRERLEVAIAALPSRLRSVVVLRDIYDLNHAEIAAELGISESAAKVRLHRARHKLRAQVLPLSTDDDVDQNEEQAHAV